jgi:hypothetical protein
MLVTSTATLAASAAGDASGAPFAEHPDRVVTLTTNQRQRTEQGRAIADALHQRDVDTAWQRIKDGESVIVTRSREDKLRVLAATVADFIGEYGASDVTCDAVTNAEVDELNTRIHDRLIDLGSIDPAGVVAYQSGSRERRLGAGTVLRVSVEFDDGRTRSMSPRTLLAHFDYGCAGTTHKVQGRTSAVHIASLGPAKDIASRYVSASRAREATLFVVDARDYLTDSELVAMQSWQPAHVDDEVLERVHAALTRRTDRIDSPRANLRPAPQPAPYVPPTSYGPRPGFGGMGL